MLARLRSSLLLSVLAASGVAAQETPPPPGQEVTQLRARHILVQAGDGAAAKIAAIKKQIEAEVAREVAKLPAPNNSDKERARILDAAFARIAAKESACPSKTSGGDIGWFGRHGVVVEPFAKAAFAVQPFHMSEPLVTEFGHHLILVTDRKTVRGTEKGVLPPKLPR